MNKFGKIALATVGGLILLGGIGNAMDGGKPVASPVAATSTTSTPVPTTSTTTTASPTTAAPVVTVTQTVAAPKPAPAPAPEPAPAKDTFDTDVQKIALETTWDAMSSTDKTNICNGWSLASIKEVLLDQFMSASGGQFDRDIAEAFFDSKC